MQNGVDVDLLPILDPVMFVNQWNVWCCVDKGKPPQLLCVLSNVLLQLGFDFKGILRGDLLFRFKIQCENGEFQSIWR